MRIMKNWNYNLIEELRKFLLGFKLILNCFDDWLILMSLDRIDDRLISLWEKRVFSSMMNPYDW